MNELEMIDIIKGLGLSNTRYKFLSSMINFIDSHEKDLITKSNDELIKLKAAIDGKIVCSKNIITIS